MLLGVNGTASCLNIVRCFGDLKRLGCDEVDKAYIHALTNTRTGKTLAFVAAKATVEEAKGVRPVRYHPAVRPPPLNPETPLEEFLAACKRAGHSLSCGIVAKWLHAPGHLGFNEGEVAHKITTRPTLQYAPLDVVWDLV